jgi:type 1 glutamine amidotransferase
MPSSRAVPWTVIVLATATGLSACAGAQDPQPKPGNGAGGSAAASTGGSSGSAAGGATGSGGSTTQVPISTGGNAGMASGGSTGKPEPDASASETAAPVDTAAKPDANAGGTPDQATTTPPPAGQRILVHTLRTGFRHESAVPASMILREKLTALGFMVQVGEDPSVFSDTGLAPFKIVIMAQASGSPFGSNAGGADALIKWVRAGGGLVGFHAATDLGLPTTSPYVALIGGKFIGHPGGFKTTRCETTGMPHASVTKMMSPFMIRDEIYTFSAQNPANQVVVQCAAASGGGQVPISWHRVEGTGRVFYTGLGHPNELWTANSMLVNDHVVPAILWAAGH